MLPLAAAGLVIAFAGSHRWLGSVRAVGLRWVAALVLAFALNPGHLAASEHTPELERIDVDQLRDHVHTGDIDTVLVVEGSSYEMSFDIEATSRGTEEVTAVLPVLLSTVDETQVGFVDQRSGGQRVVASLSSHP